MGARKITIYCHNSTGNYADRNTKIKNLMLMLGDDNAERMLHEEIIELKY